MFDRRAAFKPCSTDFSAAIDAYAISPFADTRERGFDFMQLLTLKAQLCGGMTVVFAGGGAITAQTLDNLLALPF